MDATRVAELKSALKQRADQIDEGITKGVKVDGSNVEVSQETANRIRSPMGEATEIKSLLDAEVFDRGQGVDERPLLIRRGP